MTVKEFIKTYSYNVHKGPPKIRFNWTPILGEDKSKKRDDAIYSIIGMRATPRDISINLSIESTYEMNVVHQKTGIKITLNGSAEIEPIEDQGIDDMLSNILDETYNIGE